MSSSFDLTGRLVAVMDIVERPSKNGGDPFRTREFVIEVGNDIGGRIITNYIKFQSVMDKTALIDAFQLHDIIKVHFNIKGSKYQNRTTGLDGYITNLDAWRIEKAVEAGGDAAPANAGGYAQAPATARPVANTAPANDASNDADDLPF